LFKKFIEDYIGQKIERGIDPMDCVAIGASIQGGILTGELRCSFVRCCSFDIGNRDIGLML